MNERSDFSLPSSLHVACLMKKKLIQPDWWNFLNGFWRSPGAVGSITPSSAWLVQATLAASNVSQADTIVEFGPGTGVFTDEIIRQMKPDARLFVFEVDHDFCSRLQARISDSRVQIIEDSAAEVKTYLEKADITQIDCLVSGVPFVSLPGALAAKILGTVRDILAPNGVAVAYQYSPLRLGMFKKYFPKARIVRYVLRNVPPALVFRLTK